jgi:uncharacterized protein (DUF362 family)/NAD-dependent dihydropyrimidine dehydrogenase PreA subunit
VTAPDDSPHVLLLRAAYDGLAPAVSRVLDHYPLPWRGSRVLVKPNMLGPYPPERGITTHPALVRAVVEGLLDRGARPMVGDNPGARGYGINDRCGEVTGIKEAARGHFVNLGELPVTTRLDSPLADRAVVSRPVLEADLVVSLPKMKSHVQTILTGSVKNTYGYLVGGEKSRLHSLARTGKVFEGLLAAVYAIRPPSLTIVDAVTAMEGDGPSGGRPREVGLLVASPDALAADRVLCRLMGIGPGDLFYLAEVARRFPGTGDWSRVGPESPEPLPGFALPATFGRALKSYLANWILFSFLRRSQVRFVRERCRSCGACVEGCPAGALGLQEGYPRLDRQRCIACYCCHELCPHAAVELDPLLRRLLSLGTVARPKP